MGQVYRARDSKLQRDVAVKVLPEAFAHDPERLARFEREARTLAALNHPNIAHVYGLEESGGIHGLVMELVEGPTLADRIQRGALPIDEAGPIAAQIARALEAAHESGIIHRDLKPANVKVRADGGVKVLDFGLAKALDSAGPGAPSSASLMPTMASPAQLTGAGMLMGTAAYMSPEQARGRGVDQRADIWALGCVLYEMLTGRQVFGHSDTVSDAVAAVLTREPDWSALPAATPAALRALVRRCLQKDAARRLHHVADARIELEDLQSGSGPTTEPLAVVARPNPSRRLLAATAAVAVLASGVAAWAGWRLRTDAGGPAAASQVTRLELNLPGGVELFTSTSRTVAASPDGKSVAFVGTFGGSRLLYLRRVDEFEATAIRGTDNATTAFYSPDSQSLGFVTSAGELKTVSVADQVVVTAAKEASLLYGATWTPDDHLIFVRGGGLWLVPRTAGEPKSLTKLGAGETVHAWPIVVPGGRALLFGTQVGERWRIESLILATGERKVVVPDGTLPLLGPGGYLFFYRSGELLAVPFDQDQLRVTGQPIKTLENIPAIALGAPIADVSASGAVVFAPSTALRRLVWVSRGGGEEPVVDAPRSYTNPRVSPDGGRIVVQAGAVWVLDLRRNTFELLATQNTEGNAFPMWLPDGKSMMHRSGVGLRVQTTEGGGQGRTIPGTTEFDYPATTTPDGKTLVLMRSSAASNFDLFVMPLDDPSRVAPLVQTSAYEGGARLSPDGRWLVYTSNESGRNEVYVRPFPGIDRRWQVSTDGGTQPTWSRAGNEVFYRSGDKMVAVGVKTAGTDVVLSPPQVLFERTYAYGAGITIANYDVSPDGQRFVMVKDESTAGRLRMILNWSPDKSRGAQSP